MKKLPLFIPALLMFITLVGLFVFMCLPQSLRRTGAQDGVLDLRGEALNSIAPLRGEWEFIYGELLTPKELSLRPKDTVVVPRSWDDAGYPLTGCATYRLTVLLEEGIPLTLFLPEISSAYVLWINGEAVRASGTVSESGDEGRPYFENALIAVRAESGVLEIVLQVSNYHFMYGGLHDTLLLGESSTLLSWFLRTRAFYCVALGCVLMAAFYHLTLYIHRWREKTYLLFSLLCFLCFARFLMETNGLNEYFGWLPMNMAGIRLYFVMFFSHSIGIAVFSLHIFNREFLRRRKYIVAAYFTLVVIISLVMPTDTSVYIIVTAAVVLAMTLFTIAAAARSPVLKENSAVRLYFAALIVYLVIGASSKLFLDNVLFMMGLLSNMFMVMSQCLVLSRRYSEAFLFAEETNQNLEQIVCERTQSLQAANESMLAANNAMKELVSNISHDLKTPLAVMSVNLETLSELAATQSDADYQRHVRTAYQKNLDLQRLIQNLFEVSRIETGRNLYAPEWISILRLLTRAREKYDGFLEDKGISLDIKVDNDMEISADPQRVWNVFDNIIYNAARHTEGGGSIMITARGMDGRAVVTVTDTGCGIAPEHLPRIFDRFYKGSQSRGAKEGDSGLGLYIVKSVMEDIGGSVCAESELGRGTAIILTFQAKQTG